MARRRGVGRDGRAKSSTRVFEVRLSRPVGIGPPFLSRFFVGRETHPSYDESTDDSPYAGHYDCIPARNDSGDDSKLSDVLELIAKRLDNLENKRYFPSPKFEHIVKINSDKEVISAEMAATRAAASADTASKAAIAATAACNSAIAKNMRLSAIQRERARMTTASKLHTASRDDIPQAAHVTATCPASPECIRSY